MSFNALEDKVILKLVEIEETTQSGLIIPDSATEIPTQGTVVAVGPGRITANGTLIPTGINVGDRVIFNKRGGQLIEIEGEEYLIFLAEHILATVTD